MEKETENMKPKLNYCGYFIYQLNSKMNRKGFDMNTTHEMHIEGHGFMPLDGDIKYRNISQPSVDGSNPLVSSVFQNSHSPTAAPVSGWWM